MSSTLKLEVSGVSFSSLVYEMMNCEGDQEGFLFGNARTKVIGDISDSQLNYQKEEFIISIHQTMPCDQVYSFCDAQGVIDDERLKKLLNAHRFEDLIGWYRFRRNSTLDVFFQERAIHENLLQLIPNDRRSYFLFGIFTSTTSDNVATHTVEHSFIRRNDRNFETVPVTVVNLGDTAHTNYKTDPPLVLNRETGSYGELIHSLRNPIIDNEGVTGSMKDISDVQASIQPIFNKLCRRLGETEQELSRLREEIARLKTSHKHVEIHKYPEGHSLGTNTIQEQIGRISLGGSTKSPGRSAKNMSGDEISRRKPTEVKSTPEYKLQAANISQNVQKESMKDLIDLNDVSKSHEET